MINENFIYLGVLLQAYGGLITIINTLKGTTKPNRVSWFLWMLSPFIAVVAMLSQGVSFIQTLTTFIVGFIPLLVFLSSFVNKDAEWKLGKFDYMCGALSLIGILLWVITKQGNIALLFSILADASASVPTLIKSWNKPETETVEGYSYGSINAGIGLLVIKQWNFQNFGFPLYWFIVSTLLMVLIYFKIGKRMRYIKAGSPPSRG